MAFPYTPPTEIDGEPEEVRQEAITQLRRMLDETELMARNAFMTRFFEESPSLTGIAAAAAWDESDEKAAYFRVAVLVKQLSEL